MKSDCLSLKEAQRLMLSSQKLTGAVQTPLQIIEHLGYVQIDTISVVERAHHHVLWTRCPKYQPSDLESLVKARKVFEYWSHAASYLPMRDYRFTLPMKKKFAEKKSSWSPREPKLMKRVLKRIQREGPLRSKDFKAEQKSTSSGWWDWKPAKKALERLFLEGQLEITRREGFQKVYDLPERVIPEAVDTSYPSQKEHMRFLIQRTLRHHGLATAGEIGYLQKKNVVENIRKELHEMSDSREIVKVTVEGVAQPYYAFPKAIERIPRVSSKILLLSPFDNFVIQRKKLAHFFQFDYQIECYVPEAKRKYGYFCLPIFNGVVPIGRIDCKADRVNKQLLIRSLHIEKNVNKKDDEVKIEAQLRSFAKFNKCH